MRATCLAAGGRLLSGGAIPITNDDLNTESISLLVEISDFDYIVSGDLTGGGSTSTAKTPDIETFVGQMAGDVDVAQLNHHGSTTTSNQVYLAHDQGGSRGGAGSARTTRSATRTARRSTGT